jgi:hypothetical protein
MAETAALYSTDSDPALGPLQTAACTYRIALGPRAGQKVLSLQTVPSQEAPPTEQRCVNAQGFSLHAEVRLGRPSAQETRTPVIVTYPVMLCSSRNSLDSFPTARSGHITYLEALC